MLSLCKKTQVTEKIFQMTLIHASVIYQIPCVFIEFNENSASFRENFNE